MGYGYNSHLIATEHCKYSKNSQTMPFIVIIKSNKDMKVTVEDILKIRPGKTRTFILSNPRECHSAVSLVCYVKKTRKPADISNYSTTTDWESNSISITAIGN